MGKTLKFGGGVWATKKGSTLAYNDEDGNFKPLPFTYTGAGKGTRVNKEGLIEVVENDRPRIDYTDSEDGVFLLENAATNLVTHSEDFSNASWTKSNTTVTSGFLSPSGDLSATKIVENSSNSQHKIQELSVSITAGDVTFSQFIKKGVVRNKVLLEVGGNGGSARFDLDLGIVISENGVIAKINSYNNDWYRCSVSFTPTASAIYIGTYILDDNENISYQGDGTSGIYIWGVQVEQGNLSSYIPTQGTIQTRVAETASGSGNSGVFNSEQGVLFANIAANADDGVNKFISISDGTISNRINIVFDTSNNINARQAPGGVNISTSGVSILNSNKIAYEYQSGSQELWVNGFKIGETNVSTLPSGLDRLSFDSFNGGDNMYCKTKEIAYYDEVLTDIELETLTSYRTWEAMVKELNLNIIHNE